MLKLKDIFRIAKSDFIPLMKQIGFVRYGRKYMFVRRHADYFQVISFLGNRHGNKFYLTVDVWVPSLCGFEKVSKAEFESTACAFNLGGNYKEGNIDASKGIDYPVSEDECVSLLASLYGEIETYILPWFSYMADRDILLDHYFKEPKSSIREKRKLDVCDYQEIEKIIPDSSGKISLSDVTLVGTEANFIEAAVEEKFLSKGMSNFIKHASEYGFEYFGAPRSYLAKKHHEVYHFVEFNFVNSGLFLEVSISVYIDGQPNSYPAHREDKSVCDIKEEWPVFFYTPLKYRLTNEYGHEPFPCYEEMVFEESVNIIIEKFDDVYQSQVENVKTKKDFKRLVMESKNAF